VDVTRRRLIRRIGLGSCAMFGAGALPMLRSGAWAASGSDYKALVCVFLDGGNDGNNLIVPLDATGYSNYQTARQGLALDRASLLPVSAGTAQTSYGLHPATPELKTLFDGGKLAFLANVGTLARPTTRAALQTGNAPVPDNLFSHSDQVEQWQAAVIQGLPESGWGGRAADALGGGSPTFPIAATVNGSVLFTEGAQARPAVVSGSGASLDGVDVTNAADPRLVAMTAAANDSDSALIQVAGGSVQTALGQIKAVQTVLSGLATLATPFPDTDLGNQLKVVAQLMQGRATLGLSRQIFFASTGGFDTHSNQLSDQGDLLTQVSQALSAFYQATTELGIAAQVTTFTMSDFARTLKPASGGGSDHGWGNHHMILGGAVRGRDVYGTFPSLILDGPDDEGDEGRWVPTTSMDQYAATLLNWFGVPSASMASVLPNLAHFPAGPLTFLG